jgi:hypothetical protein
MLPPCRGPRPPATVEPPEPQQLKVDTLPQTLPLPCYVDVMECVLVSKWMQGIEFFSKMLYAGSYLPLHEKLALVTDVDRLW